MVHAGFVKTIRFSLVGAWLMGTAFLWVVSTENFRRVDEVLSSSHSEFHQRLEYLPSGDARLALRFLASELNRFYFTTWGNFQLVLGGVILLMSLRMVADLPDFGLLTAMWILSAILTIWVTPSLIEIGRQIDFVPRFPPPPQIETFWRYHLAYILTDVGKFGAGLFWLLRASLKQT